VDEDRALSSRAQKSSCNDAPLLFLVPKPTSASEANLTHQKAKVSGAERRREKIEPLCEGLERNWNHPQTVSYRRCGSVPPRQLGRAFEVVLVGNIAINRPNVGSSHGPAEVV